MSSESSAVPRLQGIDAKLDRAEEHLACIQRRGMTWVSKEESWDIIPKINKRERRYVVALRLRKPAPPVLPLMVDEVVHHLRSSLDHLASYLVEWSEGSAGRAAWPITRSRREWERTVAKREHWFQIWRKERGGPLAGASPEVRAFIEGHQPYRRTGETRADPLLDLDVLWNAEKHRILNPIRVLGADTFGEWSDLFHPTPQIDPVRFKWILKPQDELKLGTERTLAMLEFPRTGPFPKVVMDGQIPVQVLVGDGEGKGSLWDDLVLIRGIVSEAKTLFPPPK